MSSFVDEAQVNVRGGDGGAGACRSAARRTSPRAVPTAATAAPAATSGCRPTATSRRCSRSATTRTARPSRARTARARSATARAASDLVVDVPEGTQVTARDGELLADLVRHGDRWLAARGGQGGRGNARFLSNARRAPELRRAGRVRRGALAAARAEAARRRRARRLPQRGQVDAHLRGQRGQAEDRRLPVHHARAEPRRRALPATTSSCSPTSPASSRARPRGAGSGTSSCATSSGRACSSLLLDLAPVDGRAPAEQERILLDELGRYRPELLDRPRLVVGTKADVADRPDAASSTALAHLGRHPRRARRVPRPARRRWSTRRAAAEPEPEPFVVLRPAEEGFSVVRDDDGAWRVLGPAAPSASSPWPTSPTPRRSRTCSTACARWASSRRWRGPAPARATSCASVRSSSTTSRGSADGARFVVKVGTSSITPTRGELDDAVAAQALPRARGGARRRPRGRAGELGRDRRRAARARADRRARPTSARCRRSPPSASPG